MVFLSTQVHFLTIVTVEGGPRSQNGALRRVDIAEDVEECQRRNPHPLLDPVEEPLDRVRVVERKDVRIGAFRLLEGVDERDDPALPVGVLNTRSDVYAIVVFFSKSMSMAQGSSTLLIFVFNGVPIPKRHRPGNENPTPPET